MPEMDGYQATRAIRKGEAGERYKNIPIIAMTANAMKGDKEQCLRVGMDDYIAKPIDPDTLHIAIQKWSVSTGNEEPVPEESVNAAPMVAPSEKKAAPLTWNKAAALKRVRNKEERLKMLIDMFLSDMPERVSGISKLVDDSDMDELAKLAHTCKGVAGNLGAERLMQAAAELEQAGKERDEDKAIRALPDFNKEYAEFIKELKG